VKRKEKSHLNVWFVFFPRNPKPILKQPKKASSTTGALVGVLGHSSQEQGVPGNTLL
jgi:hypothetical protein